MSGAGVGAVLTPALGGVLATGRAVGRYAANNMDALRDPAALADRVIAERLRRDGRDVNRAVTEVAQANAPREGVPQPLVLADVTGDNTRALAGQITRLPGEGRTAAREFVEGRQIGSDKMPS